MEQVLLAAEETRNSREGVRAEAPAPAPAAAPSSKPRTPLHPGQPLEEPVVITADVTAASVPETDADAETDGSGPAGGTGGPSERAPDDDSTADEEAGEVDRFSLAREFGQLLQDEGTGADG